MVIKFKLKIFVVVAIQIILLLAWAIVVVNYWSNLSSGLSSAVRLSEFEEKYNSFGNINATVSLKGEAARFVVDKDAVYKQYSIHPRACSDAGLAPFWVIGVINKPSGFQRRQAIRNTYGTLANPVCRIRLFFMHGRIYDEPTLKMLRVESNLYGDIIQSNQFDDAYRASSIKTLHMYQWFATFCPNATFTSRIDDDNWLNLPRYYKFLKDAPMENAIYGSPVGDNSRVVRSPDDKYGVPREEYGNDRYPAYLSGMFFTVPTRTLLGLLSASRKIPITFLDDVYIAGMVASAANLTRVPVPDMAWDPRSRETNCPKRDRMCIHYSTVKEFYQLWEDPCYRYVDACDT